MNYSQEKVTVYTSSEFMGDIIKMEVSLNSIEVKKYAQYNDSILINYREKRKRSDSVLRLTYNPFCVILKGWGHPEPSSGFIVTEDNDIATVTKSKYCCFDSRYKREFLAELSPYLTDMCITPILKVISARGMEDYAYCNK